MKPADTGDHLDPSNWTTLVLDETFDPKSADAQSYLLNFCDRLFETFGQVSEDYQCPMVVSYESVISVYLLVTRFFRQYNPLLFRTHPTIGI